MNLEIVTFHFANNYGAVLQAYALQAHLSQYGNVEFLSYEPEHLRKLYSLNPFSCGIHPREIVRRARAIPYKRKQLELFSNFRKNDLRCANPDTSDIDLAKNILNKADAVIYGSDQIWNLGITNSDSIYFGDYIDKTVKKIAYAASFGADNDPNSISQFVKKYLNTFDALSVREQSGVKLLSDNGVSNADVVCDPVFLLDKDCWINIARKPVENIPENYILYYALRKDEKLIRAAKKVGKDYGIPMFSIHPNGDRSFMIENQLHKIGPKEFVWLIKNAAYICTNSFHAVAFSSIFKKKVVFHGYENGKGRVESLLSILKSPEFFYKDEKGNDIFDLEKAEYKGLKELKQQSIRYLKDNIKPKESV